MDQNVFDYRHSTQNQIAKNVCNLIYDWSSRSLGIKLKLDSNAVQIVVIVVMPFDIPLCLQTVQELLIIILYHLMAIIMGSERLLWVMKIF